MSQNKGDDVPAIEQCHEYEGICYPNIVLDSSIEALKTFEVRHDDVWVVSVPKSGTHWMLEIAGLILNDGYPERIDRTLSSSTLEMINMDQEFPGSDKDKVNMPVDMSPFLQLAASAPSPRVMMTHMRLGRLPPDALKKAKVICLVRNPKDITTSWFEFNSHSPYYRTTWEENLQEFMDGKMHWGPWFEHVQEFWKLRSLDNLLIVFYEELLLNPLNEIRRIANHLHRPLSAEALQRVVEKSTMTSMKQTYERLATEGQSSIVQAADMHPFLNKGKCGRWKDRFTVSQNEMFDEWYRQKTGNTDLKIIFE